MNAELKNLALSNALSSIRSGIEFPHNVFVRGWTDFRFFDATVMLLSGFVDDVQAIRTCIGTIHMDQPVPRTCVEKFAARSIESLGNAFLFVFKHAHRSGYDGSTGDQGVDGSQGLVEYI